MHKTPIAIAIAEDNRFALKACLNKLSVYNDFVITLTAFNGQELLVKLPDYQVDLVLMDIQMPGMNGIEATALIKNQFPQLKVLLLATFDDDENIFKGILAGANGYSFKEENGEDLREAILEIFSGGAAMSAGVALRILNLPENTLQPKADETRGHVLTKSDIELLTQLKNGLSYEQIANSLFLSYHTLRKQIESVYQKLAAKP